MSQNMFSICFLQLPVGEDEEIGMHQQYNFNTCHMSLSFSWSQICASICEIWNLKYSGYRYNPMGCNKMGIQMGCNQMNYNQMGADETRYNQMVCNQMGCGQVWGSQQRTMAVTMKDKAFSRKRCERVLLKNGRILDHQSLATARWCY